MGGLFAPLAVGLLLGAQPWAASLSKAHRQLEAGDFAGAAAVLESAVAERDVPDEGLIRLYRLLGLASLHLGREDEARRAYGEVLQALPDDEVPSAEPAEIRAAFARLRDELRKKSPKPALSMDPLDPKRGDEPLEFPAFIKDAPLGATARLHYRREGATAYGSVEFAHVPGAARGRVLATLPGYEVPAEPTAYRMEYYVDVTDLKQRRIAGRGDAADPLRVFILAERSTVASAPATPWYKKPWVWMVAGAVAAGAGVGIYIAASQHPSGTLPITIQVNP